MADQQQPSNAFTVDIAGAALPPDVAQALVRVVVDSDRHVPDLFVLTFRDPHRTVLADAHATLGAPVKIGVLPQGEAAPQPLLTGEVTAVELEHDPAGTFTVVRGYDRSHRLHRGRHTCAYTDVTYADVAREVAKRAGLDPGRIDATPTVHPHVSQGNTSDWQLLSRLAAEVGYEVAVTDGKLDFAAPTRSDAAPGAAKLDSTNPLQLALGADLLRLRAVVSAAEQVKEVQIRGWDTATKRVLVGIAPARTDAASVGVVPADVAATFGAGTYVGVDTPYGTQSEVDRAATAVSEQVAGGLAELEGVARGNPKLKAGVAVTLGLLGAPFDGRYTVTTVRHVYEADTGFTSTFTVSGRRRRSLLGMADGSGAAGTAGGSGRIAGVVPAQVADVHDPDDLGRVRLRFGWLADDYTSDWARVAQPGAGADRGAVVLPEVNDEVLVAFEQGDLRRPYVLGGLHNGVDRPPLGHDLVDGTTGAVRRRGFVSRQGHALVFLDDPADSGVALLTGDRSLRLALNGTDRKVKVHADGTVEISGTSGVTVKSDADLTVEAAGGLTLKGATVTVQGSGTVAVSGSTITLN